METVNSFDSQVPAKEQQKSDHSRLSRKKLLILIEDLESELEFFSKKAIIEIERLEQKLINQTAHA